MSLMIGNFLIQIGIALGGTCGKDLPPAPGGRREIGSSALRRIIRASFPQGDIHLGDGYFFLPSLEDVELFLDKDETDKYKYIRDEPGVFSYDCNKSAARLYGQFMVPGWADFTFGLMWTGTHALNMFVDQNEDLWVVEPQNDKIRSNLEAWQGSSMRFVVV